MTAVVMPVPGTTRVHRKSLDEHAVVAEALPRALQHTETRSTA